MPFLLAVGLLAIAVDFLVDPNPQSVTERCLHGSGAQRAAACNLVRAERPSLWREGTYGVRRIAPRR